MFVSFIADVLYMGYIICILARYCRWRHLSLLPSH